MSPSAILGNIPLRNVEILPVTNFMPPGGESFEFAAGIIIPPVSATFTTVVSFIVPNGRNAMVKRIANVFVGGGFTDFSGAIIWQLVQDLSQTGPPIVPNYDNIVASLGTVNNPCNIDGIRVKEFQVFALQVRNVSVAPAGQFVGGRLGGYFYPINLEPPDIAF